SDKKILAVFGATGLQGGSVIQHFLNHPDLLTTFSLRALTRTPSSPKAQELASKGIAVVHADLDKAASLTTALAGAHAVFLVTDFWSHPDEPGYEVTQLKSALHVLASLDTLEHSIFSSLPSISRATNGSVTSVRHFDGKAAVTSWLQTAHPELWRKTSVLWIGVYFQAWKLFPLAPSKSLTPDGNEVWVQTSTAYTESELPTIDVRDTGFVVRSITQHGPTRLGGKIVKMAESMPLGQMLETCSRILKKSTHFQHISDADAAAGMQQLGL
ncbi:NAD(P)-binding protein, partial [Setomelanomma holmii]